jgi:hypothetical protein
MKNTPYLQVPCLEETFSGIFLLGIVEGRSSFDALIEMERIATF